LFLFGGEVLSFRRVLRHNFIRHRTSRRRSEHFQMLVDRLANSDQI
jgi:hypothetical protein